MDATFRNYGIFHELTTAVPTDQGILQVGWFRNKGKTNLYIYLPPQMQ